MKRAAKILGALLAMLLIVAVTGVFIARSGWLREKVRLRVISEMEKATGGRVEIGKFQWNWQTLTAELDDLVLHGTEPAGAPPLLRVKTLVVGLKIVSLWKEDFDIAMLRVDEPKTYLLVAADGSTNVPNPKVPQKSDKSAAETILDLRITQFALNNGSVEVHASGQEPKTASYDAVGSNLESKFVYEPVGPDYRGTLAIAPLDLRYGAARPLAVNVKLDVAVEKNRVRVNNARLDTRESHAELSGSLDNFNAPVITAQYSAGLSLAELRSVVKLKSRQSGAVQLDGNARYVSAADYLVTGNLHAKDVAYSAPGINLRDIRADSGVRADPKKIELSAMRIGALGGTIAGRAEIRELDAFEATGHLSHFDVRRIAGLATKQKLPYDGLLDGPFEVRGRLSDTRNQHFTAAAKLAIAPAPDSVPVTGSIDGQYEGAHDVITLAPSYVALPSTRLDLSGVLGQQLKVHLESRNLDDLLPAISASKPIPVNVAPAGTLAFDGTVAGKLDSPRIEGHVTGHNFVVQGQVINAFAADVAAESTSARLSRASLSYKNLRGTFEGSVGLRKWQPENDQPVTASLSLQNAQIADLLAIAGQKDIPATGVLNTSAQVRGTIGNPQASATLDVTKGSVYGEPFDRLTGKLNYSNNGAELGEFQLKAGPKQLDLKASYQHAANDLLNGKLQFDLTSNRMALDQFQNVRKYRAGLNGAFQLSAAGDVLIAETKQGARVDLGKINADASAAGLVMDNRPLGDVKLTVRTEGQQAQLHLENDIAQAVIRGDGKFQLAGDYPGTAQITFSKVDLASLQKLLMTPSPNQKLSVGGSIEGRVDLSGPAAKPVEMTARLEVPRVELRPGGSPQLADFVIRNTGAVRVSMANSIVRVESARFEAKETDVTIGGTVNLKQKTPLDLRVNGRVNLAVAKTFAPDLTSSGSLAANATVRGSFTQPQVTGQMDLQNGNFSIAGVPNGLFNANGRILFDGSRATIENLAGETGGGTVKLTGFAAFGSTTALHLNATATGVRVRYPEGVSSVSDANLDLTGTMERSTLSGDITVQKISYNPQSDIGSILLLSGSPAATESAPTGLLAGMQLDVKIVTSPDITFQTGLVQDLETEANLRLRGTISAPALLGRLIISQGSLVFFGNRYTINQGTIAFYNPVKIEPVINIDLETKVRGVDVTLTIAGPMSKLNVTFTSDPPLQYADIIGLLATGKTPSDPTIAARQADTQLSWEQMGANALVGQAIANPVAGRLQRFFGVSRLKIDPLLPGLGGGGSSASGGSPGARLSLEQQITPNVIFDYVINTTATSSQLVRVEWDLGKHWSAVMLREENSAFGIDFLYKKRLK